MLFVFLLCLILPTLSVAGIQSSEGSEGGSYESSHQSCECGNSRDVGYPSYSGYRCSSSCSNRYYGSKYLKRYYYDNYKGYCLPFYYYGCGGNGNNFESRYKCEETCGIGGNGNKKRRPRRICLVCPSLGPPSCRDGKCPVKRSIKSPYCTPGAGGCYGNDCNCKDGYKCCLTSCYNNPKPKARRRRDDGGGDYHQYRYECVRPIKKRCYYGNAGASSRAAGSVIPAAPEILNQAAGSVSPAAPDTLNQTAT